MVVVMSREERMRAVVEAIARYREEQGYAPSVRDVMERTGFSSTSVVAYWLGECEDGGLILRERSAHRAIRLTAAGRTFAGASSERPPVSAVESAAGGRAA